MRPLEKKSDKICFLIFRNCPLKVVQGDAVYILSALKVFLKRMKQKRPLKVVGTGFIYLQLSATDLVLVSADFRILESNDNINTFLTSYLKLL